MISTELVAKYGLREADALDAVEVAIARALTRALNKNVTVRINDKLEITAFSHRGEPVDVSPEQINRKLRRHIFHLVELELRKRQALRESEDLGQLRGTTLPGEITRIADNGTLRVALEFSDVFRQLALAGECPVDHQPVHERGRYRVGDVREFFISSVLPVAVNGRQTFVRIRLSRTSKELPALLLQERTGVYGIECQRRVAGGFSNIVTPTRLPKEAINHVGKELGERLNVSISQTP